MSLTSYHLSPFIAGLLEHGLNHVLFRDRYLKTVYQPLKGKTLTFNVKELPAPLTLCFSEQRIDVISSNDVNADCTLTTTFNELIKLKDRTALSTLLRQGQIVIDGDISIIQYFSTLIDLTNWDFAELIAPYTGDVAAEIIAKTHKNVTHQLSTFSTQITKRLSLLVLEERPLLINKLMAINFFDEIDLLSKHVDQLEERMNKLDMTSWE